MSWAPSSRWSTFDGPELLSPAVQAEVERFLDAHLYLFEPDCAEGGCFLVSVMFQEHLERAGLLENGAQGVAWDVVQVDAVGAARSPIDTNVHWVFRLGDVLIDWTVRQFLPEAPVPLVWRAAPGDWWPGDEEFASA